MNLKRILEQQEATQFYDLGRDFSSFTQTMDSTTEDVKNRFEQAIATKLKGKKIRARASRGYKQFEKDYEINVTSVSLDDYYDNYVVVVKDSKNKEYFLKPGFKVQVLGAAEADKQEQPQQPPEQPPAQPQPAPQPPQAQPAATPPPAEPQQPVKETDGSEGGSELVHKYPVASIEKDLQTWLPKLLMNSNANLKQFIPQDGVSRTKGRKTVISYGLTIPTDELPGLSAEQIKQELSQVGKMASDVSGIDNFYTLDKFDVRGGKYVIIIRKVTNY